MENKENDIENLFQERFTNDEVSVSPRIWQNIKHTLPKDKGISRFGFSSNVILWSIISILVVSAISASFILLPKNHFTVSSIPFQQEKQGSSAQETKVYAISDRKDKYRTDTTNTINSILIDHSTAQAMDEIIKEHHFESRPKKSILSHYPSRSSRSAESIKNSSPFNEYNFASATKNNKSLVKANNKNRSALNTANKSLRIKKLWYKKTNYTIDESVAKHSYNNLEERNKKNQISNTATHTLQTVGYDFVANTNAKKINFSTERFAHAEDSTIDLFFLTDRNINNIIIHTGSSFIRQKIKSGESILINRINSKEELNISQQKNNRAVSTDYTSHLNNNWYSSSLNHQLIDWLLLTSSVSDSSPTKLGADSNFVTKESFPIQKDGSKNIDLMASNDTSDTSLLQNDSLYLDSSVPCASLVVGLMEPLDSQQAIAKDSVLSDATTKKEKSMSSLLNRISFDVLAAAFVTGVSTKATDSLYQSAVEDKNQNDKNSWGYSAGITINYKLSDRLHVSTGIVYTTFSEQYNFNYHLKKTEWILIDSTLQSRQVDSINREIKVNDHYSFISLPILFSYNFITKDKLRLSILAGIRSNILINGVTYLANAGKTEVMEMRSGFNNLSFSYLFALEAEYKLNDYTALLLQPTFIYAASSIHNKASALSQKPYGMGLTLGLRFTF